MSAGTASPATALPRAIGALVLALAAATFYPDPPDAESHALPCARIRVEIADRGVVVASYEVAEPEYVSRVHRQIDANGNQGSWTVASGDLGYAVTYACVA